VRLHRPALTADAAPALGSRSRLLLLFACLSTAAVSVAAPNQPPHRNELAALALLAALLLLRRHQAQPATHTDSSEHAAGLERTATEQPDTEQLAELPDPAHDVAVDQLAKFQAPARRLLQTRNSHARELALAQLTHTLATHQQQLTELRREQTTAKLATRDRLTDLEDRLAQLKTRAQADQQALQQHHNQHIDQLNRLHQSINRHTDTLQHLQDSLDP
jgi:hypothetical protein